MLELPAKFEQANAIGQPADLAGVDAVESLKQRVQMAKADSQKSSLTSSLDNPNTAGLYAKAQTGARREGQRWPAVPADHRAHSGQPANDHHSSNGSDANAHGHSSASKSTPESQHTVAKGETLEGLAHKALGRHASPQDVARYARVTADLNGIDDPKTLPTGAKIDLPGHAKDGTLTFTNPDNKDEHWAVHKDGSSDVHNKADGTSFTRRPLDDFGSYQEQHKGGKPGDNYDESYTNKSNLTLTTGQDAHGNAVTTGSDGYKKVTDKKGNWQASFGPDNQVDRASYDKATGVATQHNRDGSTITSFDKDNHTEAVDADGTKTTKWNDGSVMVQKNDGQGGQTGHVRHPDGQGGYSEHGWGTQSKDNYDETYNSKSGTTTRVEAKGTAEEKTTTEWENGTVKVEAQDGKNYQGNADGSEHHWGNENYDKPAYDYQNDEQLNKNKEILNKAVDNHIPADKKGAFQKDMADFETRAQKDHLSPDEVGKTYEQMSKMLNTEDDKAAVSGQNRALLAQGLIHQSAHPNDTDQGNHDTCNVTSQAMQTLKRNPAKAAEVAATTATTGKWTAPDGKVINIDKQSLSPGAEESVYPPTQQGDRSYATQVLNLVMANDALQRRVPPESYVQRTPDRSAPDDSGERKLDASGQVINSKHYDAATNMWNSAAVNGPGLTDHEVAAVSTRLNGRESHLLSVGNAQGGVDNINNEQDLADKLHQFKQQGEFPVTLAVDGHHMPVQEDGNEEPDFGAHFVSIDGYDEKTGRVHVSNQWGQKSRKWVDMKDLYTNASGDLASSLDGVDAVR